MSPIAATKPGGDREIDAGDRHQPLDRCIVERALGDLPVEHAQGPHPAGRVRADAARSRPARRRVPAGASSQARPSALNRSACGHFGIRWACRIACTSFLIRVRWRTTW